VRYFAYRRAPFSERSALVCRRSRSHPPPTASKALAACSCLGALRLDGTLFARVAPHHSLHRKPGGAGGRAGWRLGLVFDLRTSLRGVVRAESACLTGPSCTTQGAG